MTRPTRRTLLGSAAALGVRATLGGGAAVPAPARADGGLPFDAGPAQDALRRLLPHHAAQFRLVPLAPGDGAGDRFRVGGRAGRIEVAATTPATLLTGVHHYLRHTCGAQLSWGGDQLALPERLPAPGASAERSCGLPHRFALNDTHDGYTAPYADWPRWERLIDLLALHGVNEVLVTPGSEAVYHRLLTGFGYSDAEARAWIPQPTHQPWWLLQNMSDYGGPIDPALPARRARLGRRICDRLRALGMRPVLPGYFGTVPVDFAARNPGAATVPQGVWAGLRRPDWLDPRTGAFADVAAAFYRHQRELLGPAGLFKMDLLHEGGDAGDVPVADAARAVERALRTAHPGATWVILGWQENPRPELLDGVDRDRMLIVDGLSDLDTVADRERDWRGTPYAFGTIPNFGGRTTIGAKTHRWTERFTVWRDKPGSALAGTAYMPEAAERDPAAFALFAELAWSERPVDRAAWFDGWADTRYGGPDTAARAAFAALRTSAYEIASADGRPHDAVFAARPDLAARSGTAHATHTPACDPAAVDTAFAALLDVRPALRGADTYRHDLTDLARQALANRSWQLIPQLQEAYGRGDGAAFGALSALWLRLMQLSEEVTGAHRRFLLGPWLAEARAAAAGDAALAARLERSARALITSWADRPTADGGKLARYANRDWHGLIGEVYLPQWRAYLDELADALAAGREPAAFDWYAQEEEWTRRRDRHPERPVADAYRTARRVRDVLAAAPYQGTLTVAAQPAALPPGGRARVTAALRNVSGLRATGRVDFALSGPEAAPDGPLSLPSVGPGATGRARWQVTAPAGPPKDPLSPLPYTLTATYGPRGEARVRAVREGTLWVAGPLAAGLATVTTNAAVFGQLAERFAIDGGGADLWRATAEFGAVYRPGALAAGGSAQVEVVRQDATAPWARAGLIVRNGLSAAPGSAGARGFLNLSVTPANGVVLSYDATGDGTLDTYARLTGVTAPVTLRLARGADEAGGGTYTGACSVDGGATWREVGTVRVPGAAAAQDTGLHQCAASSAPGTRGTAEFRRWSVR
ncbi:MULTISPECIES: alpha-N-acetylglucosaminidase [Streptomyces]|uniref:Alpha-N-acetylglucosaminidase n=1 Tax=Streptomyces ramulosus TaxID=47762 RepID=A0ABW1FJH3_9ACTN